MWPRFINIAVGVWLMAAPSVLGYGGRARTNDTIVGALALTSAIVALSEVMRPVRWINVVLGVWLLLAPWYLGFGWYTCAPTVRWRAAGVDGARPRPDRITFWRRLVGTVADAW